MTETTTWFSNLTTSDFLVVLDEIKLLVPILIPAVLAFIGFRKAWGFFKSQIKGA